MVAWYYKLNARKHFVIQQTAADVYWPIYLRRIYLPPSHGASVNETDRSIPGLLAVCWFRGLECQREAPFATFGYRVKVIARCPHNSRNSGAYPPLHLAGGWTTWQGVGPLGRGWTSVETLNGYREQVYSSEFFYAITFRLIRLIEKLYWICWDRVNNVFCGLTRTCQEICGANSSAVTSDSMSFNFLK
jgi:hypothetical protein